MTVEQYHQMADAGILLDGAPVELIEGLLVRKMTKHRPHTIATHRLRTLFPALLPVGWYFDSQEPVTTADSEPEPDGCVIRGALEDYQTRQPLAEETALLIEVSDTTLAFDRGTKKRIYARAGIPIYWILNLVAREVEVYQDPTGPDEEPVYRESMIYRPGDRVPLVLDGVTVGEIAVSDLLP
jgi:Uma2 family endonuclease